MKVLYHFRTRGTGAEAVHITGMAGALERAGHSVHFCSPSGAPPRAGHSPFAAGGAAPRTPGLLARLAFELLELAYNLLAWGRLRRWLRTPGLGLIYERHAFFLCVSAWLPRPAGVPLVVEVNELVGDERVRAQPLLASLACAADRTLFRAADLILVVSPHLARRVAAMGIPERKILVVPNAVHPDQTTLRDGMPLREALGLQGRCVIGFVGWFVAWHRLEDLVRATAVLAAGQEVHLLLVGEGPLQAALTAQIAELGLAARVTFTGPVPHERMPEYLAAMDVAVVPHSNEYRSPIKLFEYMAQAKAVVAPATEPVRTTVEDGAEAVLFAPGDYPGFLAALRRVVADAPLRTRLGQAAQAAVLQRHLWDHRVRQVLEKVFAPEAVATVKGEVWK